MRPVKTFWRGIALLLPTIATIVVISFVFNLIVHTVGLKIVMDYLWATFRNGSVLH